MTPADLKKAIRLYTQYKTTTREYRELAEKNGMNITELNSLCWKCKRIK